MWKKTHTSLLFPSSLSLDSDPVTRTKSIVTRAGPNPGDSQGRDVKLVRDPLRASLNNPPVLQWLKSHQAKPEEADRVGVGGVKEDMICRDAIRERGRERKPGGGEMCER